MITNLFLSVLAGFLSALSFDLPHFSFLMWFSLAPLFYIFYKVRRPEGYFFIAAVTHYAVVIFWLSFVTHLGTSLAIVYLALYWAIFAYFAKFFPKKFSVFVLPVLWVVMEFIRENVPVLGFGWAILGYSQFKNIFFIQIADIFGVKFISLTIVAINVIITYCLYTRKILVKQILFGLILIAVCIGYSAYALNRYKAGQRFRISVVQPNIPQELKWSSAARPFIISKMLNLGKRTESNSLVIYPEASWPGVLDMQENGTFIKWARDLGRDTIIGVVTKEEGRFYNAAIFVDKNGNIKGQYRKIRLVPFGEYVPWRKLLWFVPVFNTMGDISRGRKEYIFKYNNKKFGILICFEDTFPHLVSDFARKCDFLVNITNDAWFKGNPQSTQHLSVMAFRAVENRISIVRSANTGISGYVDFLGRIHSFKKSGREVFVEGVGAFSLPLNNKRSVYSRIGDFPYIFLVLVLFVHLLYYKRNKRKNVGRRTSHINKELNGR